MKKGYKSFQELALAFAIGEKTFKKELRRVKGLTLRKYQRFLSPAEQNKIFQHMGDPFT